MLLLLDMSVVHVVGLMLWWVFSTVLHLLVVMLVLKHQVRFDCKVLFFFWYVRIKRVYNVEVFGVVMFFHAGSSSCLFGALLAVVCGCLPERSSCAWEIKHPVAKWRSSACCSATFVLAVIKIAKIFRWSHIFQITSPRCFHISTLQIIVNLKVQARRNWMKTWFKIVLVFTLCVWFLAITFLSFMLIKLADWESWLTVLLAFLIAKVEASVGGILPWLPTSKVRSLIIQVNLSSMLLILLLFSLHFLYF